MRTLGTSLLTLAAADMVIFIAPYRGATKAGQMTLEQAKTTIDESDFIASYYGKAEVILGTANHIAMSDMVIFSAP